jgi:ribose-phosphate pyrophosphokinase
MNAAVLCCPDQAGLAGRFAEAIGARCTPLELRRFPDGESLLRLPVPLPPRVFFYNTLANPNERLIELLLAARTARRHGVEHLSLIAPYLCYMRQDLEFVPGEAVSQRIIGEFLAGLFDAVVTVDPHLHRVGTLAQAVPVSLPVTLTAAAPIAEFVARTVPGAALVGPDAESEQWVARIAEAAGMPFTVCHKQRFGDRDVQVVLPEHPVGHWIGTDALRNRPVVLVDDIASSGQTLAQAARACRRAGARSVDAIVTHALCGDAEMASMHEAGIGQLWSSDSLPHPTNAFSIAALLAAGCREHGLG